jgi:hypothetical protein
MSVFDGLYGYECVMLVCGFVLFVFALAAITVMLVQRRSMKALVTLLLISIVMIGFPGIQSIKFSHDLVEIDHARSQQPTGMSAAQKQQYADALANVQQRSGGQSLLQAKVADGWRAIGDVDKAYDVAQSVLKERPPPAARKLLVPVLTAKLEQSTPAPHADGPAPINTARQKEIATVASQLQSQTQNAPLPADSHIALAKAYVAIGQTAHARTSVEAARHVDPRIKVEPALQKAIRQPPGSSANGGH